MLMVMRFIFIFLNPEIDVYHRHRGMYNTGRGGPRSDEGGEAAHLETNNKLVSG